MLMSAADYRESLRRHRPRVFVDGRRVESVADEPLLAPAINAIGVTYDFALKPELKPVMTAQQAGSNRTVNRFLHLNRSGGDLLNKLEAVRLVCQESGCALRYLTQDATNAIHSATWRMDADEGTEYHPRLLEYLRYLEDNGRPESPPARAERCRQLRAHRRAARRRHRHPRREGHRHRRAARPRAAGDAVPGHDRGRRRLRRVLRGAGRRRGHHHGGAPGRPAR
jgi:hypothetical protein